MKIIENLDKLVWEEFLLLNPGNSGVEFLLSPEWFELTKREGSEAQVLAVVGGVSEKESTVLVSDILALIILIKTPLSSNFFYYYAPRGPLLRAGLDEARKKEVIGFLLKAIRRLNEKAVFLKIEPSCGGSDLWKNIFPARSLASIFRIKRASDVQPKKTLVLDISKSEEELLADMHQKTRYNIRLASKRGVTIEEGGLDDFYSFWNLMEKTGERDAFRIHSEKHYENLLSSDSDFIKLYFAVHEGKKIAAAIVCFYGKKATYLHGASDNEYRRLMAPHLLQFELIKVAKSRGCDLYDFYGIDALKWPGVTRFKMGFSGEEKKYAGVYDIVFRSMYYRVYRLGKGLKRIAKKILKK